jgi:hypothetical protein
VSASVITVPLRPASWSDKHRHKTSQTDTFSAHLLHTLFKPHAPASHAPGHSLTRSDLSPDSYQISVSLVPGTRPLQRVLRLDALVTTSAVSKTQPSASRKFRGSQPVGTGSRRFLFRTVPDLESRSGLAECCACIGINQWCSGLSRDTPARPAILRLADENGGRQGTKNEKGKDSRISPPVGCWNVRSIMSIDEFGDPLPPHSFRVVGATNGRCTGNKNSEKICPHFKESRTAAGLVKSIMAKSGEHRSD